MLGYRSLFAVDSLTVIDAVRAQLYSWLRHKRYEADALVEDGDPAAVGRAAEAVMTSESLQDGSRSLLFTLRESGDPNGAWISQVIAHEPARGKNSPWVWIDVEQEGAEQRIAKIPNLARGLLGVLYARDGGGALGATPTRVSADDVPELVLALESDSRRGPIFVAGTSETLPLTRWSEYVGTLLHDTVGMAAGYVLDASATEALRDSVGERHAVAPGSLRTYLPGLDPDSDLDALRHRFLTTETILRTPRGRIERTLGQRARDIALAAPVPRFAARVESRLLAATDARVLGWKPTALLEPPVVRNRPEPVLPTVHVDPPTPLTAAASPLESRPVAELPMPARETSANLLEVRAQELFGAELSEELLQHLAQMQRDLVQVQAENTTLITSVDRAGQRATQLNNRVLSLEHAATIARRESEDAQTEWAEATDELARSERRARELQRRLAKAAVEDAWDPLPEPSGLESHPDSFADLLVRLDEFSYLRFTLDEDRTAALDERQPYWATKAWLALLALEDYARSKGEGSFSGSVDHYLKHTPDGCAAYSSNRHARDESEDVKTNAKFAAARMFPVPHEVDPAGVIFMGAHFKIAQYGMISPRLHYVDATGIDGRIYVGHLGEHLPTGKTN